MDNVVGSVKRETGRSFVDLGYGLAYRWWPGSATSLFDRAERGHDGIFWLPPFSFSKRDQSLNHTFGHG